jgi:hypothetical protein
MTTKEANQFIQTNDINNQKWMFEEDACKYLNCDRKTLKKARDLGKLKFSRPGKRRIYYKSEWLDEYILQGVR